MRSDQIRTYSRRESVVFLKTTEPFGGLSNMAGGFPLRVNGIRILTAEALYQACRFPHLPEVQSLIIEQRSPMTAKMKSKPYRRESRPDWDHVRVKIMRWCLRVKLVQNWRTFSSLLLETGERSIVEESRKDDFWGANPVDEPTLLGMNVLGRLLMELREAVKAESRDSFLQVEPITIPDFLLGGRPIGTVTAEQREAVTTLAQPVAHPSRGNVGSQEFAQPSFFDAPMVKEPTPPVFLDGSLKVVRIVDLKPYPEYKETGLPWLGQVPTHWEIKRAKSIFQCVDQRSKTGKEELLSVSSAHGVVPRKTAKVTMFKAESYLGYKLCWPGDLVINSLWAWGGGLGVSSHHGIISSAYSVYRIRRNTAMTPAFVHAVVRSASFNWELQVRSKGVWISRLQLTDISFLDAPMYIPTPAEQTAIVRFLDWSNGRLERAIRAKRKVIALLIEQKQAIIHCAVTRGLDPTVPLKPSGIPWVGDIPKHWELKRAKQVCTGIIDCKNRTPNLVAGGAFTVVRTTNIRHGRFNLAGSYSTGPQEYAIWTQRGAPRVGDVFFTREAPVGEACLVPDLDNLCMGQRMMYFRPDATVLDAEFLLHSIYGPVVRTYIEVEANGSTVGHLRLGQVSALPLLWCPVEEQRMIVAHIATESAPLNATIVRFEREIELLREYRTRLVADVVTGKLDVREAAARLPEEIATDTVEEPVDLSDEFETADEEATV